MLKRSLLPTLFAVVPLSCVTALAQAPPPGPPPQPSPQPVVQQVVCPTVRTSTATAPVKQGNEVEFVASVSGGGPNVVPLFNWSVSDGFIASGQGTPMIRVDTNGVIGQIVATVEIWGFAPGCQVVANSTATVFKPAETKKIAEFGLLPDAESISRLDDLIAELETWPDNVGYVIAYPSKGGAATAAVDFLKRASTHASSRSVETRRFRTLEGGQKDEFTVELWIVEPGASPPKPEPARGPAQKPGTTTKAAPTVKRTTGRPPGR